MGLLVFRHKLFAYCSVGIPSYTVCLWFCWCSVSRCLSMADPSYTVRLWICWRSVIRRLSMSLLVFRQKLFVYGSAGVRYTLFVLEIDGVPSHILCLSVF